MPAFEKGHKKTGGRKLGSTNKAKAEIKELLNGLLPPDELRKRWKFFLDHRDPQIRYKAFELANAYMFGKPVVAIAGAEDQPPVMINISAIPRKRERVD
jgi:hypothetical protein